LKLEQKSGIIQGKGNNCIDEKSSCQFGQGLWVLDFARTDILLKNISDFLSVRKLRCIKEAQQINSTKLRSTVFGLHNR